MNKIYRVVVDGGGTKTEAVVSFCDGDKPRLFKGRAGPSNPFTSDTAAAAEQIRTAIVAAVREAATAASPHQAGESSATSVMPGPDTPVPCIEQPIVIGLAGVGDPEMRQRMQGACEQVLAPNRVVIETDWELLMRCQPGRAVFVAAGTGSYAAARDEAGRVHRVGGHGYLISDEGSGYWIGRESLRAIVSAEEGRGLQTKMAASRLQATAGSPIAAVRAIVTATDAHAKMAAFTAETVAAANAGDSVARGILLRAGRELATLAVAAVDGRRSQRAPRSTLERIEPRRQPIPLVVSGSVLCGIKTVRDALVESSHDLGLTIQSVSLIASPAEAYASQVPEQPV